MWFDLMKGFTYNKNHYEKFRQKLPLCSPLVDYINKKLGKSDVERVLEIGCGPGQNLIGLSKLFPNTKIYGIDNDKEIIEIAREHTKNYQNIIVEERDVLNTDYNKNSFDCAFHNLVSTFFSDDKKRRLYKEVSRVLKEGKYYFFLEFNTSHQYSRRYYQLINSGNRNNILMNLYSEEDLEDLEKFFNVDLYESRKNEGESVFIGRNKKFIP